MSTKLCRKYQKTCNLEHDAHLSGNGSTKYIDLQTCRIDLNAFSILDTY